MRFTIYNSYIDLVSGHIDDGFMRGDNDNGYSLSEAVTLITTSAHDALPIAGTMTVDAVMHGDMSEDEWHYRVRVEGEDWVITWSLCGM